MPPIYLEGNENALAHIPESKKRKAEDPLLDEVPREAKSAKDEQTTHSGKTVVDSIGKLVFVMPGPSESHVGGAVSVVSMRFRC